MLFFMGASGHLGGYGRVPLSSEGGVSGTAMAICLILILALEANAIKGRMDHGQRGGCHSSRYRADGRAARDHAGSMTLSRHCLRRR